MLYEVITIEKEPGLEEVIIVKNENNTGLIRKLEEIGYLHTVLRIEEIHELRGKEKAEERREEEAGERRGEDAKEETWEKDSNLTFIVNLLEFSLDGFPDRLREVVYETIA